MPHHNVECERSSSQSDEAAIDEAAAQTTEELQVQQVIEDPIMEEHEQDDHTSTNEQLSISTDNEGQVSEINNFSDNEEQVRVMEAENEIAEDEATQIRHWAISNNIQQNTLSELLAILRRRLLPELPTSAKTFLQTEAATYNIREMEAADNSIGQFVYFGIAEGLKRCINEAYMKISKCYCK